MVNHKRNLKTLIICFVIALFALVPLRFVEEGNKTIYESREQILGEEVIMVNEEVVEEVLTDEVEVEEVVEEKKLNIILPDSDIQYLIERIY